MMNEIVQPQIEARLSVLPEQHDLAEFVLELRLAVRSEPHHLVLVAVFPKAQVLRDRRVEETERVREGDRSGNRQFLVTAYAPHRAGEISQSVDRQQRRLVETGDEKRTGQMRLVMFDPRDFRRQLLRINVQRPGDLFFDRRELALWR